MHVRKLHWIIALFFLVGSLRAQDIHFTQFYMMPLTLNPGFTGKFEGTVRLGGIYRDQWRSVINQKFDDGTESVRNDQFKTPGAWADAPIIKGFRKKDWIGLGLGFVSDKAGQGDLSYTGFSLNGAYHLALNKKGTTMLSLGFGFGSISRKIDRTKLRFEDGILDGNPKASQDYAALGDKTMANANFRDLMGGIVLSSQLNKQMDFNIGFSMFHIAEPRATLIGKDTTSPGSGPIVQSVETPLRRRSVVHGRFNIKTNDRVTISPMFMYQTMAGADEIQLQTMANYLFDPEKDVTFGVGAGYRMRDAFQILLGYQKKDLQVGFAYDINTSDLSAVSRFRGGFEIAANYIIKIYKPAVVKPKVLCPRF
jgi:type IX secretion system PorP/SprF family membrane protein